MNLPKHRPDPAFKAGKGTPPPTGRRLGMTARALKASMKGSDHAVPDPAVRQALLKRLGGR